MKQDYEKMSMSLRYWLQGKGYFKALKAMEFAAKYHTGTRKDGVTREFEHQISQAQICRTLVAYLLHPEETLCVIFLHDIVEDYDVTYDMILELFGKMVADATWRMTKKTKNLVKTDDLYFGELAECPIASLCKGFDRIHNLLSMDNVFNKKKQESYIAVAVDRILPMMKKARRSFPEQEPAYENLKFIMNQQISLYQSMHKHMAKNEA